MSSSTQASPIELVEPCERRLGGADSRERLLGVGAAVVCLEPERADHGRQRQALHDERAEHDREREEDDQVAAGKRRRRRPCGAGCSSAAAIVTAPRMPFQAMNAE